MDITKLNIAAKEFASQLLDLVGALSGKMVERSDDSIRPHGLNKDQCAGFAMREEIDGELNLYAYLLAKTDGNDALLRISGIVVSQDTTGEDMFNSLTLQFDVDETLASQTTSMATDTEVDDIRRALNHEKTTLRSLRHSNTKDPLIDSGNSKAYDLNVNDEDEISIVTKNDQPVNVSIDKLSSSIREILDMFQKLAKINL